MLDPALRPVKDRVLLPLARALGPRLHPDLLSLLGFAAGLGAVALVTRRAYAAGLVLWLLNRVLDGLDGVVARMYRLQSDFGGYLDLLLDFVVYALLPIGLVLGLPPHPRLSVALALLLASFYVNAASWMYLAALLEKRGRGARARGEPTSIAMPRGLVEGTETIAFFCLFLLMPEHLTGLFLLMAALVTATVGQRLVWARRRLR